MLACLQQPPLREAHRRRTPHDNVVQHPDLHQGQGVLQAPCEYLIRPTGLSHAGRVVVGEDHGSCVEEEGRLDHLPGMDGTAVDGAPEQPAEVDDPVSLIQEQAAEDLVLVPGQLGDEVIPRISRAAEGGPPGEPGGDQVPGGADELVDGDGTGGGVGAVVLVDVEGGFHGLRLLMVNDADQEPSAAALGGIRFQAVHPGFRIRKPIRGRPPFQGDPHEGP